MSGNRRRRNRVPVALLVLGAAMLVFGFWTVFQQGDAYRVEFSDSGQECEGNALTLDEDDGEPLRCNFHDTGTRQFSPDERRLLVTLAGQLGRDGLSDGDKARIRELNAQIAATHGDPGIADPRILSAGHFCAVTGLPVLMLASFWWSQSQGSR
jgi:hypothetical protein